MHYWPRPLASLNALAPILHLVVPYPVLAVSIVRPRPSAPPLAGLRSVRRVDLTGALDLSPLIPILVPLRGSLRWRADSLPRGVFSWCMPLSRLVSFAPLFDPSSPSLVSSHFEIDFTGWCCPCFSVPVLSPCLSPLVPPSSLFASLRSLDPYLFHHNAASLTPSGLADRSVAWWFTSDSLSFLSQPSVTGGLTQNWLWPPLPRGSPGCNVLAAGGFLHSLSSPLLSLGGYFPEGHNPACTHWPGSAHWNLAYRVTSRRKADGSQ